jgi:acetyltransferase AlgX (SGNH hydrolase-like protein)
MSEKVLKFLIYITGIVCLFVFIAIRIQPLFNSILKEKVVEYYWDRTKYGEMYYFSMIKHFREEGLPPAKEKFELSERQATINEAEILTFGDSFFEFSRLKQFPERMADDFQKRVHTVKEDFPLKYLQDLSYNDTLPKLLVYERTERYIPISFEIEHTLNSAVVHDLSSGRDVMSKMKNMLFYKKSEELYNVVLKRSYLTTGLYSFFSTLKFDLFGQISKMTPVYHLDGDRSWLFYFDQLDGEKTSFYYQHSAEEMDMICNNMADLADKLKKEYNIYLVYLPIPAKYTINHELMNQDKYNGFLPSLYEGLDERRIRYVNIYNDFLESPDTLYYRTDSHWTQAGIDLAYSRTMDYIESDPELKVLLESK